MSHALLTGLSGYLIVKDAIKGDYPVVEAARSLLPICNEVLIADCESDDGTLEMLTHFAATEVKVRVISIPWPLLPSYEQWKADVPRPANDHHFWPALINRVRPLLRYQFQIHLDADEVLFPCAFPEIIKCMDEGGCRWMKRLNFWRDAQSLVPPGWVCGDYVARLGPTALWMPSDEQHPEGEPEMRVKATKHESIVCGHYGFLRKDAAFYAKSKRMQPALAGTYDSRLEEAERTGAPWWTVSTFPGGLVPYTGTHPDVILPWLKERGRLLA